jgi:hypothetical protein
MTRLLYDAVTNTHLPVDVVESVWTWHLSCVLRTEVADVQR